MKKPYPCLCKDCKHSFLKGDNSWFLRCKNPKVNARDPAALSDGNGDGTNCQNERTNGFFSACGMAGRLWEKK
jgi:hypothetical protein